MSTKGDDSNQTPIVYKIGSTPSLAEFPFVINHKAYLEQVKLQKPVPIKSLIQQPKPKNKNSGVGLFSGAVGLGVLALIALAGD